jgi:hypothetical protein
MLERVRIQDLDSEIQQSYGSSSNLRKLWVALDSHIKTVLRILVRIRYPVLCGIRDGKKIRIRDPG